MTRSPAVARTGAWALTVVATPSLAFAMIPLRGTQLGLAAALLVLLLEVFVVGLLGGVAPGLSAALLALGLVDWYYVTPLHSLRIAHLADVAVLAVYFAGALAVSVLTARLTRERDAVRQAQAEASANVRTEGDRLRSAILASVSHDLRTPLASIKAAATSVLSPEVDWSREAVQSFCEVIDQEADRLNRVVANLLDLSRLRADSLQLEPEATSLDDVTGAALVSLHRDTSPVQTELSDCVPLVRVDPAALEHVLANLLDNALNWSPPGAAVTVTARPVDQRVRLVVADRGPGIPPQRRRDVRQTFQRLHDHAGAQPTGIGLGLAVAEGLTEAMGGRLAIEGTPGGGTSVVVDLPTPLVPPEPAARP